MTATLLRTEDVSIASTFVPAISVINFPMSYFILNFFPLLPPFLCWQNLGQYRSQLIQSQNEEKVGRGHRVSWVLAPEGNGKNFLLVAQKFEEFAGRTGNWQLGTKKCVKIQQLATVGQSCQILKHEIHIKRALGLSAGIPIEIAASVDSEEGE